MLCGKRTAIGGSGDWAFSFFSGSEMNRIDWNAVQTLAPRV